MDIEKKDNITIIRTDERLDALVAPALKDMVQKVVKGGSIRVIIDLERTEFLDSSGCGALVASLRAIAKNEGDMKICRPSPQAQMLFELTRLDRVFEIYNDLDRAMQSF